MYLNLGVATASGQRQITAFAAPGNRRCTNVRNQQLTSMITDMVAQDLLPLSFVDGTGFRQLMSCVEPEYHVPSRMTITRQLEARYEACAQGIKDQLSKASYVSITTDGWTSNTTESYITVTCHFIAEWQLKSVVLQTRAASERHTAQNLAELMKATVDEWGLKGKVIACVHDNASNIVAANKPEFVPWKSWPCVAHTLQLAVNDGLKKAKIDEIATVCNKLVGHFHHSTVALKALEEKQRMTSIPPHRLIVSCITRWNSLCDMFNRLCEQRPAISAVLADRNVTKLAEERKLALQHDQWQVIEEILPVLQALKCATTALSADMYVSVSNVFPVMHALITNHLQSSEDDSATVDLFKEEVRRSLTQRLFASSVPITSKLPAISAFLDPRHKHLCFLTDSNKVAVKEHVFNLMSASVEETVDRQMEIETETVSVSNIEEDDLADEHQYSKKPRTLKQTGAMKLLLGSDYGRMQETSLDNTELQAQFLAYTNEAIMSLNTDPLKWWQANSQRYKMMVPTVLAYLSIPATSVPSERVSFVKHCC